MSIKEETKNLEFSAITLEPQRGKKKKKRTSQSKQKRWGGFQKLTHFMRMDDLLVLGLGKKNESLLAFSSSIQPFHPWTHRRNCLWIPNRHLSQRVH